MEKYKAEKLIKFATNKAGKKLIQSFNNDILTVTVLTYAATPAIVSKDKGLVPNGKPNTTSLIMPDKNIKPYPNDFGCLKTQ